MGYSAFSALQPAQKIAWIREVFVHVRDKSFFFKNGSDTGQAAVHIINELTKTEKGDIAQIPLLFDLKGDGVVGDNERTGKQESMATAWCSVKIDQLYHMVGNAGKMEEQKSVISARKYARPQLTKWWADKIDELAFLTLSGISYAYNLDGSARAASELPTLSFASDVSAPSANRHVRWTGTALVAGATGSIDSSHVLSYKALTEINAFAKENYIPGIESGGDEYRLLILNPLVHAKLKQDPDYQRSVNNGADRGITKNPWFTGGDVMVDGLVVKSHNRVFNTRGAASGLKWGAGGAVNGCRNLLLGAQALALADLSDTGSWNEEMENKGNRWTIGMDRMFGMRKTVFPSKLAPAGAVEDFATLAIDSYLG